MRVAIEKKKCFSGKLSLLFVFSKATPMELHPSWRFKMKIDQGGSPPRPQNKIFNINTFIPFAFRCLLFHPVNAQEDNAP